MKYSETIRPISYVVSNAAEVIRRLNEGKGTIIITTNGFPTAVLLGIARYEEIQEQLRFSKKER